MEALTSVIIVNYNKRSYTELCLSSLLHTRYRPLELLLVDNGSTDGTQEFLREFRAREARADVGVELILNDSNLGAVRARNQALERAGGDCLAFLDNDTALRDPLWLPKLKAVLDADERNGIVGPKLLYPFEPYNIECAGCEVTLGGRVRYRGRGQGREDPDFNQLREVQALISAVWLMKRALYDELGPLDEVYSPVQFEDIDYCYRARQVGYRVWYEPAAEMYHFENTTTDGSVDLNFRYLTIRNGLIFKQRWSGMFAGEGGPPDSEAYWEPLPTKPLELTGTPPVLTHSS